MCQAYGTAAHIPCTHRPMHSIPLCQAQIRTASPELQENSTCCVALQDLRQCWRLGHAQAHALQLQLVVLVVVIFHVSVVADALQLRLCVLQNKMSE